MKSVVLACLFFAACGSEPCTVSYERDVAPLIADSCLACHSRNVRGANRQSAPREANYDTYDDVVSQAPEIVARLSGSGAPMPPLSASTPRLSSQQATLVGTWHRCGNPP